MAERNSKEPYAHGNYKNYGDRNREKSVQRLLATLQGCTRARAESQKKTLSAISLHKETPKAS
jgi:hypothetical protein